MLENSEFGIRNSEFGIAIHPPTEKPQITQIDADEIAIGIAIDPSDLYGYPGTRLKEQGPATRPCGRDKAPQERINTQENIVVHASRVHIGCIPLPEREHAHIRGRAGGNSKLKTQNSKLRTEASSLRLEDSHATLDRDRHADKGAGDTIDEAALAVHGPV